MQDILNFAGTHALEILFGLISVVTSVIAIHYARKSLRPTTDHLTEALAGRSVRVFLSRQDMIASLLEQYEDARPGEEIWAQTVGMQNYPGNVSGAILTAAGRGIKFRFLVNATSPALREFQDLFAPVRSAEIRLAHDNKLRIQGVGDRKVIVAYPTMTTYTAIEFKDEAFVAVVKSWYNARWESIGAETDEEETR